jgi:hypothetical protein
MAAHYLNVPVLPDGTRVEWEHKETSMANGRSVRKLFQIPIVLNPGDSADCNYPGEIIVAHDVEGARVPRQDYIFIGPPTPDMEPLNEEAEAITERLREGWIQNNIDPMSATGMAQAGRLNSLEQSFLDAMTKVYTANAGQMPQPNTAVATSDYEEMKERVAKLEALIASQNKAPTTERRA